MTNEKHQKEEHHYLYWGDYKNMCLVPKQAEVVIAEAKLKQAKKRRGEAAKYYTTSSIGSSRACRKC